MGRDIRSRVGRDIRIFRGPRRGCGSGPRVWSATCSAPRPRRHGVDPEPRRPRTSRSRALAKAGRSLPHVNDPPTVAAVVVIEARQVRADRGEGHVNAAGAHEGAMVTHDAHIAPLVPLCLAQRNGSHHHREHLLLSVPNDGWIRGAREIERQHVHAEGAGRQFERPRLRHREEMQADLF